jgi:zinc transporter 5/7
VLGFLVNLVGLFFFHDHHSHHHAHDDHDHNHGSHAHDHSNENLYGVFLHILADALGSVGVIFSSILVKYYGYYIADPICSFIISVMILVSVVPLL